MSDPHNKIDALLESKGKPDRYHKEGNKDKVVLSKQLEQIRENVVFANKVNTNPVVTDEFDMDIFGHVLNFNSYIEQQAFPSSIYFIDKLVRLNMKADLEWKKRYLAKKRPINMKILWFIIIVFGIVVGIIILLMLLPRFLGGGPLG